MLKQKGFTLIEALISVTVLAFVLAITYQSLSIFLNVANKSRGNFSTVEQEIMMRLKLRASIRSMFDYYVTSSDDSKSIKHYLLSTQTYIRYISLTPIYLNHENEVAVYLSITENERGQQLRIEECPLSDILPYTITERWQTTENCQITLMPTYYDNITIELENIIAQTEATAHLNSSIINKEVELRHLLPVSITFSFISGENIYRWKFIPSIENLSKYLSIQNGDIHV